MCKHAEKTPEELLNTVAELEQESKDADLLIALYEENEKKLMTKLLSCEDTIADLKRKHHGELLAKDKLITKLRAEIAEKGAVIGKLHDRDEEKQLALVSVTSQAKGLIGDWTKEYSELDGVNTQLRLACAELREKFLLMHGASLNALHEMSAHNSRVMQTMAHIAHQEMIAAKNQTIGIVLMLSKDHSAEMKETMTGLMATFMESAEKDKRQMEANYRQIIDSNIDLATKGLSTTANLGAHALNHMGMAHERSTSIQQSLVEQSQSFVTTMGGVMKDFSRMHVEGIKNAKGNTTILSTQRSSLDQSHSGNLSSQQTSSTKNTTNTKNNGSYNTAKLF